MEYVYNKLKSFIISNVNSEFSKMESDITYIPFTEDCIYFGTVDITKIKKGLICAIVPDSQDELKDDISDYCEQSSLTVTFMFQNDEYKSLVKKMCRYACAFRNAILKDTSLLGTVQDCEIGERKFFPNVGTTDFTLTAVEIDLKVTTFTEIED